MKTIDQVYINGAFVQPHGTEKFELINPANNEVIGLVTLGDEEDARRAIGAAKAAFKTFSRTTKAERIAWLQRMEEAVSRRQDELTRVMVMEYGARCSSAG